MRIALVNGIRPQPGTGDGMTEYTYQLSEQYRRMGHDVTLLYAVDRSKRNDLPGMVYTNLQFKSRLARAARDSYDIVHITNQELGFAARIFKRGSASKVVTSIHDLMRLGKGGFNRGIAQWAYDTLVAGSIREALEYSDYIIFSASTVQRDALAKFRLRQGFSTTLLCPKESFRTAPIPERRNGAQMNVGYVGAISFRKNVRFIVDTALLLKANASVRFTIYGSGPDLENLSRMKKSNSLANVSFMGFAPEDKLMTIYDSFDLFFYPTLEEGSSLPILDAQARGLPVIALRDNNLDAEVTKYCMLAKNPEEAARIISGISANGYGKEERAASTAYARSFSWERVARETEAIYGKLVNAKG